MCQYDYLFNITFIISFIIIIISVIIISPATTEPANTSVKTLKQISDFIFKVFDELDLHPILILFFDIEDHIENLPQFTFFMNLKGDSIVMNFTLSYCRSEILLLLSFIIVEYWMVPLTAQETMK